MSRYVETWDDLDFWQSKEWEVIGARLKELEASSVPISPDNGTYFAGLDETPLSTCRVVILGQDPYPSQSLATGVAFSIPPEETHFPPTLLNIFKEYSSDLGLPFPSCGSLLPWCKQGVLLWNVIPTCQAGLPASHRNWKEWFKLTEEIIHEADQRDCVVVSCGSLARSMCGSVRTTIAVSHPSPLAALRGARPFIGSRLFSEINILVKGRFTIDWRLP